MRHVMMMVVALAACRPPWPDGTQVTAVAVEHNLPAWEQAVDEALETWQVHIGLDCPMPFYRVGAPDARPIELIPAALWPADDDHEGLIGLWYYDGGIEVMGDDPTSPKVRATLLHEIGHALLGPDHSDDPDDIMSDYGTEFTVDTVERVRAERGC